VSLGIFSEANEGTMCPGVDSASKYEYQKIPGSKAGRCVRLTTYYLLVLNVKKSGALTYRISHGPVQACSGTALFIIIYYYFYTIMSEECCIFALIFVI
jgi:hypothetical protein